MEFKISTVLLNLEMWNLNSIPKRFWNFISGEKWWYIKSKLRMNDLRITYWLLNNKSKVWEIVLVVFFFFLTAPFGIPVGVVIDGS